MHQHPAEVPLSWIVGAGASETIKIDESTLQLLLEPLIEGQSADGQIPVGARTAVGTADRDRAALSVRINRVKSPVMQVLRAQPAVFDTEEAAARELRLLKLLTSQARVWKLLAGMSGKI